MNDQQVPAQITRKALHHRAIDMRAHERSDGLFEVEGRVVDRKPFLFKGWLGGRDVPANEPVHDMGVRIVFDRFMVVRAVETFTDAAPYTICPGGGAALASLVGLSMTRGWAQHVRERLSGAAACTHLMQLLMPMATVAYQAMAPAARSADIARAADGRPLKIDSCYAYGASRGLVKENWPEYYRSEDKGEA